LITNKTVIRLLKLNDINYLSSDSLYIEENKSEDKENPYKYINQYQNQYKNQNSYQFNKNANKENELNKITKCENKISYRSQKVKFINLKNSLNLSNKLNKYTLYHFILLLLYLYFLFYIILSSYYNQIIYLISKKLNIISK